MAINQSRQYDVILDVREDRCPMPLLKAKMALSKMTLGQFLRIETCDPSSLKDIPQYIDFVGHNLLSTNENDDIYTFVIQKN